MEDENPTISLFLTLGFYYASLLILSFLAGYIEYFAFLLFVGFVGLGVIIVFILVEN